MWLSRRLWALVLGASLGAGSWAAATRRRAQGDFGTDDNNSRLQIQIPRDLFKPEGYRHKEALFGIPVFGGFIAEKLYYANSTNLCTPPPNEMVAKWTSPFILLVDRGDCTFVTKVRHAQHLGASGVLVADNRCLCGEPQCEAGDQPCQIVEPIMADDGSGADITIPSFLLYKADADRVKGELVKGTLVQAEMTWSLPSPDDRVEWQLWTSANDSSSYALKADFYDVIKALGKHQTFTPYYQVYDGGSYGCSSFADHCGSLCANQGRYCMPDPDRDPNRGYTGRDLVTESLRQKCIWKHYGGDKTENKEKDQGIGLPWWKYVKGFYDKCSVTGRFTDKGCVEEVLRSSGIDPKTIDFCMSESEESNGDNAILRTELEEKGKKSIVIVPSVYVNNVVQRGAMTAPNVLSSICAGYLQGTAPPVCNCVSSNPEQVLACVHSGNFKPNGGTSVVQQGVSWGGVLGIVSAVVIVMTAAGFVYWKRTQEQMREQVRSILAEYMPLEDAGDNEMDGFSNSRPNGRYFDSNAARPNPSVQV